MTKLLGEILADAKQRIRPVSGSASLDAQLLIAEVLDANRAHVIAHPEKVLTSKQADQIEQWVVRREQGEPIAYILGRRAFYDRDFMVTSDVLIPRPETEHLLEIALEFAETRTTLVAVDVGTGSGAIAVTFKANVPSAIVYATDISADALKVAQRNAVNHRADVEFFQGDLLQPMIDAGTTLDLVMANLPYIETEEMLELAVSKYEPRLALDGGDDGLDLVRRLLKQAEGICNKDAMILLEIGANQGEKTRNQAYELLKPADVSIIQDYAGHDRVIKILL